MLYRVVYPQITQIVYGICVICGLALLAGPIAVGQQDESIDGFQGGIRCNVVKGDAVYQRDDGKFPLESGLRLDHDDLIRSGKDSYAELLLQPGNYLRVGAGTELKIVSDDHDKMRLKLDEGAIIIEILSRDNGGFSRYLIDQATELIRVITSDAEVFINRPGVFRINTAGGRTEVVVREGEAAINGFRVKKKRKAVATSGGITGAEIDARIEDDFDKWSRERAAQLVQANKSLKKKTPWTKRLIKGETAIDVPDEDENEHIRGSIISAQPGAVNFVEDGVELSGKTKRWQQLTEKSPLETGDKLRTNANSLAELVLFPDTLLRIDASSEVLLEELSGDAITVKVVRGSAILDVARFDRKRALPLIIGGSSTSVTINDYGNYRVDARGNGNTITVREGKVLFKELPIGHCKRIEGDTISECDKQPADNFDLWSQHRGEGALYNGRVTMAAYLAHLRRGRFRSVGFWYQQPGQTTYTFVPFTSELFRSPYGGSYSTVFAPETTRINRGDFGSRNPNRRRPEIMQPKTDSKRPNP